MSRTLGSLSMPAVYYQSNYTRGFTLCIHGLVSAMNTAEAANGTRSSYICAPLPLDSKETDARVPEFQQRLEITRQSHRAHPQRLLSFLAFSIERRAHKGEREGEKKKNRGRLEALSVR